MICKALHPLEKGEEVTDNYGQVFYFKSKPDRQKELDARYWFTCGCQPCQQDWNLLGQNDKPKWKGKADNGQLDFLESLYKVSFLSKFIYYSVCLPFNKNEDDNIDKIKALKSEGRTNEV